VDGRCWLSGAVSWAGKARGERMATGQQPHYTVRLRRGDNLELEGRDPRKGGKRRRIGE
jgi:hypothetical protein